MSNSDRYLLFDPPSFFTPNDFIVLDLATWEAQAIKVKYPRAIDMTLAVMSPEEDKIVLPLYEYRGMDVLPHHLLDSIALINLATGKQSLLISGLSEEEALYPVRFVDSDWVLLSSGEPYRSYQMEYWLLNIHSRELKKVDPP